MAGNVAMGGGNRITTLPPSPITPEEGNVNGGNAIGEFVYGDWGGSSPNEWEDEKGGVGPKAQGKEGEAGWDG